MCGMAEMDASGRSLPAQLADDRIRLPRRIGEHARESRAIEGALRHQLPGVNSLRDQERCEPRWSARRRCRCAVRRRSREPARDRSSVHGAVRPWRARDRRSAGAAFRRRAPCRRGSRRAPPANRRTEEARRLSPRRDRDWHRRTRARGSRIRSADGGNARPSGHLPASARCTGNIGHPSRRHAGRRGRRTAENHAPGPYGTREFPAARRRPRASDRPRSRSRPRLRAPRRAARDASRPRRGGGAHWRRGSRCRHGHGSGAARRRRLRRLRDRCEGRPRHRTRRRRIHRRARLFP